MAFRYFAVSAFTLCACAVQAQQFGATLEQASRDIVVGYSNSPNISVSIAGKVLNSANRPEATMLGAIGYLQLLEMRRIAQLSDATSTAVKSLDPLAKRIEDLTEQVRKLNEEQLVAIQRAVVTRLDTLPLQMIADEAVVAEVRRIAIEAVETEFNLARQTEQ